MNKPEFVDWNEYRKLVNFLTSTGYVVQANQLKGLIKLGVSVDRGDFVQAARRLGDLPQKRKIGGA